MVKEASILVWFRRGDLRLSDNPALRAASETGLPVLPVFLRDEVVERVGAAALWRMGLSLESLRDDLERFGSRLILRTGAAEVAVSKLIEETGATAVFWNRAHDPASRQRDTNLKAKLKGKGIEARSFEGNLLFEPWRTKNKSGQPYKVFTPMWRAQAQQPVMEPASVPQRLLRPPVWPKSESLSDWSLVEAMGRGAAILSKRVKAGEGAARDRLEEFLDQGLAQYEEGRDALSRDGCSGLSPFLANGEIGIRQCWQAAMMRHEAGASGAQPFLRQLMWREFSWHLLFHWPELETRCWKAEWEQFPWNAEENRSEIRAWKRGRTGVEMVDAGMREMMVTGLMHNRARMVVGSYLSKHLMADWRIGRAWFEQHLIDWDAANNAVGWQWVAGCGPDASPYFRIFNPDLQASRYDKKGSYSRRWIAEGQARPPETALDFFEACPAAWKLSPRDAYPAPVVALEEGRRAALAGLERFKDQAPA
ncbi:cryptochrome/photolyase family protein [Aliiruegeria sabulilitoris]|uniref:cryptochrome/photolyase family protein n=1 Tax=Aliiruegeria sabulilitoris TaxID=1510458 RepID=UPI000831F544|nr:deoxyribodipyrimidine photo-lyase [Aliiruegeria sabulilitoris]NDR58317.1 deoxyribodipyrimidine photo-lyase [Pseudoruegeria sp. M32A2M]